MGSPTKVQSKSSFVLSNNTITVTLTSNVTAGNMIVVFVGCAQNNTIHTPTMTGETFSIWTGAGNAGTAGHGQSGVFAVNSAVGGHNAVTVTFTNATDDLHVHVIEATGQAASPRDAQGNTESTTLSVSTSGATAIANDLNLGFFFDFSNNRTFTVGSGYTAVEQTNDSTNGDAAFSELESVSSTGVQTATASGNAGDTCEQSIVSIAGTGGGGGTFEDDSFKVACPWPVEPIVSLWC